MHPIFKKKGGLFVSDGGIYKKKNRERANCLTFIHASGKRRLNT